MGRFETGNFYITAGVQHALKTTPGLSAEIQAHAASYCAGEWGDLGEHDKFLNDQAIETGADRILAKYNTSAGDVYIITEIDRSATTILFTHEY